MVCQQFDGYGSHLPVLETLRQKTNFTNIVEYGGGEFSTSYFMNIPHSHVTTIESQDYDWYLKTKKINPDTLWIPDHDDVIKYAMSNTSTKDLCFLDTHQDLRYKLAPIVTEYSFVTVLHDSESALYRYHEIPIDNKKFFWADFVLYRPWTAIMTKWETNLQFVLQHMPGLIYPNFSDNKIYLSMI